MTLWPVVVVWVASSVAMTAGWLVQRRTRNAGIVDVIWSAAMAASALFYGGVADGAFVPRVLVAMMGGVWGARLALHLLHRVLNEHEDGRYRYLREHWHDDQRKFFAFFLGQGLLTALFSLPFYVAAQNMIGGVTIFTVLGVSVWIVSIAGEAIADMQLAAFRADPAQRGRTCRQGLWRYSRHPNYFFEVLHWFAYVLLGVGAPWSWWALSWIGPALMLVSLCWITGIPFTEAQALRTRGDDYRDYQRTTSVLIPWFPKRAPAR